ncbi:cell division cycle 7-related protein kinase isoform X2 [Anopheles coustani]|uniref:cell division cycle 7-related protein kinase isoform X2 n=1 Tax=Anopheles coustani TaxID=139045 RepID=UPI00265A620E|nr:cell division cycle 7-related protein kinase isoform X2 [Anopheles coustani]
MDVGQGQQHHHQEPQPQRRQQNNDEEEGSVRRSGRGEATAMAMQTVQGNQIDGCVTAARVENNNNNNGSGSTAAAAATAASSGGGVVERIPAILDQYVLHGKIDRGTFSFVTLATRRDEQYLPMDRRRLYAIKLITQTSHPARTEREVRCMMTMGGRCNVAQIVDGFRHQDSAGLVMNYIPHEPFHLYYAQLGPAEVQRYMKELLIALGHVHRHGVIHRDVKPSNFLHSRRNGGTYMLVDFGLAQETNTGELTLCPSAGGAHRVDKRKESDEVAHASVVPMPSAKRPKPSNGAVANGDPQRDQVVFRNPLHKQQKGSNGSTVSPLKVSNNTLKDLVESPLARQIKSTAIGIGNRLKNRGSMVAMAGSTQSPLAPGCSERENKDVAEAPRAKLTAKVGAGMKQQQQRQPSDLTSCECSGRPQVCTRCLVKREMHAPRAGTPGYRPPEVLLKYPDQTTAVDIWAAGVIFVSLLSKCYPFFGNTDDMTSLAQIISVFGYERVRQAATSFNMRLVMAEEQERMEALSLRRLCQHFRALYRQRESSADAATGAPPSGGSSPPPGADDARNPGDCCANCNRPPGRCLCQERPQDRRVPKDDASPADDGTDGDCDEYGSAAYDLLERLLEVDPRKRITAAAALQHPYFEVQY